MKKKNIILSLFLIVLVILSVIGEKILSNAELFQKLELKSYDMRSKLISDDSPLGKKLNRSDKSIVIVAVDEYSLKKLQEYSDEHYGRTDWQNNVWRKTVKFIEDGEPKALLFNMVFEKVTDEPWYDRSFARTLAKYENIVMGTYLDEPIVNDDYFAQKIQINENHLIPSSTPLNVSIDNKILEENISYRESSPVSQLYSRNNVMGVLNDVLDGDSNVRKNQPIYKLEKNGQVYYMPSLAFAGFIQAMGEPSKITIKGNKIYYKDRVIPINNDGTVNLNWHKNKKSYSYVPISKILLSKKGENEIKPEFFKNKIVIIGRTLSGSNLDLSTIVKEHSTTPEMNATAIDNYLNNSVEAQKDKRFITHAPISVVVVMTVFACALIIFFGLFSKSAFIGCLNGFLSIVAFLIFSFWLFVNPSSRLIVPIMVPIYYLIVTSGIVFAYRLYREISGSTNMVKTFGKFVAPKVVTSVIKNSGKMKLKSSKKRITILFCDIKNFSTLAEKYSPEKLISDLNDLFKEIVNIILENHGTVDKFIGDCVMAYWGNDAKSENDEFLAVKTALAIKKRVNELRVKNAKDGKIIFDVKIGVNTGEAILGITGTDKFMNYTAMGDAVNLAARLESTCSNVQRDILISKSTFDAIKDEIVVLEVGKVSVKGKEEQIDVYEPIGLTEEIQAENE